jgi:tRNA pseudouridine13 synthase
MNNPGAPPVRPHDGRGLDAASARRANCRAATVRGGALGVFFARPPPPRPRAPRRRREKPPLQPLPFLTAEQPAIGGALRAAPDDFRVVELPAYEPCGEGEHLFVTFEKRGLTTPAAVGALAAALGVSPRDAGWAGLKDRHAVTVQTASFHRGDPARAAAIALPGIVVHRVARHRNKLRPGHLHGNRFVVCVRDAAAHAPSTADAVAAALAAHGVPNYYRAQRFGRDGDNAARARAWLTGRAAPPRDAFQRKLLASALQSELFNAYVARRLRDGVLGHYVEGDLAVRHPLVDRAFAIEPADAEAEYAALRCSATGPMFGRAMRWPTAAARAREADVLAEAELSLDDFARARDLAEGTRRAVRMLPGGLTVARAPAASGRPEACDLTLSFDLPAGGYATAVLREFRKTDDEQGLIPEDSSGIEAPGLGVGPAERDPDRQG